MAKTKNYNHMKIILNDINLFHPEQKLNEKNTSVLLEDGVISKIGNHLGLGC